MAGKNQYHTHHPHKQEMSNLESSDVVANILAFTNSSSSVRSVSTTFDSGYRESLKRKYPLFDLVDDREVMFEGQEGVPYDVQRIVIHNLNMAAINDDWDAFRTITRMYDIDLDLILDAMEIAHIHDKRDMALSIYKHHIKEYSSQHFPISSVHLYYDSYINKTTEKHFLDIAAREEKKEKEDSEVDRAVRHGRYATIKLGFVPQEIRDVFEENYDEVLYAQQILEPLSLICAIGFASEDDIMRQYRYANQQSHIREMLRHMNDNPTLTKHQLYTLVSIEKIPMEDRKVMIQEFMEERFFTKAMVDYVDKLLTTTNMTLTSSDPAILLHLLPHHWHPSINEDIIDTDIGNDRKFAIMQVLKLQLKKEKLVELMGDEDLESDTE